MLPKLSEPYKDRNILGMVLDELKNKSLTRIAIWKPAPPFPSASVTGSPGCYPVRTRHRMGWTSVSLLGLHSTQEARERPLTPLALSVKSHSLALSVKSHMLLPNGTFLEILQRQEGRKDHPSYIFQTCHKHTHPKI